MLKRLHFIILFRKKHICSQATTFRNHETFYHRNKQKYKSKQKTVFLLCVVLNISHFWSLDTKILICQQLFIHKKCILCTISIFLFRTLNVIKLNSNYNLLSINNINNTNNGISTNKYMLYYCVFILRAEAEIGQTSEMPEQNVKCSRV